MRGARTGRGAGSWPPARPPGRRRGSRAARLRMPRLRCGRGPENFRCGENLFRVGGATVRSWTAARAMRRCFLASPNAIWAHSARCMNVTPVGSRSGSPGGATTATWWRTRSRTPSSPSGKTAGFPRRRRHRGVAVGDRDPPLVSHLRTRSSVAAVFEHAGAVPAAEDQVLLSVEYGDIGQALARLSPEMRAVIQAVVLDGLTAKEAAHLLHVPVSTVKTRLYRAKAHLRAVLAERSS